MERERVEISWVTEKGGLYDPTSPKNAGRTPATSLRVSYRKHVHPDRPRFRSVFPPSAGQARAGTHPPIPGVSVSKQKVVAGASVSQYVSALRFLYVKTLRRHFLTEHIPFPKSPRRLPIVLSPEEVTRLIEAARNLYHRTLLRPCIPPPCDGPNFAVSRSVTSTVSG